MQKDPLIKVDNVKKYFGSTKAVDGISLKNKKGEFVALLGPNGAGKTTTFKMLCGEFAPTSGEIHINGLNIKNKMSQAR